MCPGVEVFLTPCNSSVLFLLLHFRFALFLSYQKYTKMLGVEFMDRSPGKITLDVAGRGTQVYSLIVTIPFNSTRKRMSVVVQAPDGSYTLYCKVRRNQEGGGGYSFSPVIDARGRGAMCITSMLGIG